MGSVSWRYGLGIGTDRATLVVMQRRCVIWAATASFEPGSDRVELLVGLMADLPRQRLRSPRLVVAVGPTLAQIRPLTGLPKQSDIATINQIVAHSPEVFFLRGRGQLIAGAASIAPSGQSWATAIEAVVVDEVTAAATRARVQIQGFAATVAVLPGVAGSPDPVWIDAGVAVRVHHKNGLAQQVQHLRSVPADTADVLLPDISCRQGSLWTIADAVAAAVARDLPMLQPASASVNPARGRLRGAVAVALAAAAGAIVAPVRLQLESAETRQLLETHATGIAAARTMQSDLIALTDLLEDAASFDGTRVSIAALLIDIGRVLPDHTTLRHIRVQPQQPIALTVSSRSIPEALASLERVGGIEDVHISGAVGQVNEDSGPLQHAIITFRIRPAARRLMEKAS
jgi:hypothetical protein